MALLILSTKYGVVDKEAEGVFIHHALGYNPSKIKISEEVLRKALFLEHTSRRIPVENVLSVDKTGIIPFPK